MTKSGLTLRPQEYNNTRRNTRRRRVGRSVWNIIKKMFPFEKPTSEGFIL